MLPDINDLEPILMSFKGTRYTVSAVGSIHPKRLISSFMDENTVREAWWNIKDEDVVFDIGAGYGSWTLPALAKGAYVMAFEPCRDCVFDLLTNVSANFYNRCLVVNFLVGMSRGLGVYFPDTHSIQPRGGDSENRLRITVDEYAKVSKRLDYMKIDVEGAEVSVLKGAKWALENLNPTVIIEYHPQFVVGVVKDVEDIMQPLGYKEERLDEKWGIWRK